MNFSSASKGSQGTKSTGLEVNHYSDVSSFNIFSRNKNKTVKPVKIRLYEASYAPFEHYLAAKRKKDGLSKLELTSLGGGGFVVMIQLPEKAIREMNIYNTAFECKCQNLEIERVEHKKKKKLLQLTRKTNGDTVVVEFSNSENFNYFSRALSSIIRYYEQGRLRKRKERTQRNHPLHIQNMQRNSFVAVPLDENRTGDFEGNDKPQTVENTKMNEDDRKRKKKEEKKKKKRQQVRSKNRIGGQYSGFSDVGRISEQILTPFYSTPAKAWSPRHFKSWLKYIFVQEDKTKPIVTLDKHLEILGLKRPLIMFMCSEDNDGFGQVEKRSLGDLMMQIKKYETRKRVITWDQTLHAVLENDFIRSTLKFQINLINANHGYFLIRYFYVIRKQILRLKKKEKLKRKSDGPPKQQQQQRINLGAIEKKMLLGLRRMKWDPQECRINLFSLLLYKKHMCEVIQDFETQVKDECEKRVKQHLLKQQQQEEEENEGEEDDDDEKHEHVKKKKTRKESTQEKNQRFRNLRLQHLRSVLDELEKKEGIRLQEISLVIKKGLERLELVNQKKKFVNVPKDYVKTEMIPQFIFSENRFKALRDWIIHKYDQQKRILSIGNPGDDDEILLLKTKLVISRNRRDVEVNGLKKTAMNIGNMLTNNKAVQFGAYHVSFMIGPISCSWLSNEEVSISYLSDAKLFEDIVCMDCFAPQVMSFSSLWRIFGNLSEQFVFCNVNTKYSEVNVFKTDNAMSCQDFVIKCLTDILECPKFGGIIHGFLNDLRYRCHGNLSEDLRLLSTSHITEKSKRKQFVDSFKSIWERLDMKHIVYDQDSRSKSSSEEEEQNNGNDNKKKKKKKKKKKGKKQNDNVVLIFKTHKDLDLFVNQCLEIDKDFWCNFPNVYTLLKGFDRAFWTTLFSLESIKKEISLRKGNEKCMIPKEMFDDCEPLKKKKESREIEEESEEKSCPFCMGEDEIEYMRKNAMERKMRNESDEDDIEEEEVVEVF